MLMYSFIEWDLWYFAYAFYYKASTYRRTRLIVVPDLLWQILGGDYNRLGTNANHSPFDLRIEGIPIAPNFEVIRETFMRFAQIV